MPPRSRVDEPLRSGPRSTAGDPASASELDAVLGGEALRSVYQPIVDLATGVTVAVEALVRGPKGPLESPDALFGAALRHGRLIELERLCHRAAVAGARRAGLGLPLFVNVEPEALEAGDLSFLAGTTAVYGGTTPLILEITERALTSRPAELIELLVRARELGLGIALDDVGADARSLALLPIVRPDVVKLDRRLIDGPPTAASARVLTAVAAACERTGALILAEGIETPRHRRTAGAVGATLGQGYLFGRPAPLAFRLTGDWRPPRITELQAVSEDATPYSVIAPGRPVRRTSWRFLLQVSNVLEAQARALGPDAVILAGFQSADRFTPRTADRYRLLASTAAFVAALGVGMPSQPVPGVRGASLRDDDPLRGEWSVVVLGPHFAGALVARQIDEAVRRPDFTYAVTYERYQVVRAATALMHKVVRAEGA